MQAPSGVAGVSKKAKLHETSLNLFNLKSVSQAGPKKNLRSDWQKVFLATRGPISVFGNWRVKIIFG